MKICLCFFGLVPRSIKYTINSIEEKIFDVLDKNNISYDVCMHTFLARESLNLSRSKEFNIKLDNDSWKLLKPKYYLTEYQEDFDKIYDYSKVVKYPDPWKTNYASVKNVIRQMHSQNEVTKLAKKNYDYDYYIYLRPDIIYLEDIDINLIMKHIKNERSIICEQNNHIEDKYFYCGKIAADIISKRIENFNEELEKRNKSFCYAEGYLYSAVFRNKLNVVRMKLKFNKVRAKSYDNNATTVDLA